MVKRNADSPIECYKAHLVAKGYSQRPGFNYTEVFAPTFRYAAIRTIIALAVINNLHLCSIDISHAFINGDLEETIYMRQAEGFHTGSPNQVCRLHKLLYGLTQAARQWNKKLHDALASMGFKRLESDRSIYIFIHGEVCIIIPIFIDDITFASANSAAIDSAIKELASHFKLCDLGPTTFLLGVEIIRDRSKRQISLSQCQYIVDALDRFGMSDCNPIGTPLDPGAHLSSSMSLLGDTLSCTYPFIYPIYCSYFTFISLCLHIYFLLFGYHLNLSCSQYIHSFISLLLEPPCCWKYKT